MADDNDDYSVFDRLWELTIGDRFESLVPLQIVNRGETLTIVDYRPTLIMFLTVMGFLILLVAFILVFFGIDRSAGIALVGLGASWAVCAIFLFKGTIREIYFFDKGTDSYTFVRQFIHRKELLTGSLGQFTGAYVKTVSGDDSSSYFVTLKQEGMFLTGVDEQTLREEVPMFNSFERESTIANAISSFLASRPKVDADVAAN
jgi:hypothetical protein